MEEYCSQVKDETIAKQLKVQIMKKIVHLAQISTKPVKDDILEELEDNLPFEEDIET